jgi:hypothetical protein
MRDHLKLNCFWCTVNMKSNISLYPPTMRRAHKSWKHNLLLKLQTEFYELFFRKKSTFKKCHFSCVAHERMVIEVVEVVLYSSEENVRAKRSVRHYHRSNWFINSLITLPYYHISLKRNTSHSLCTGPHTSIIDKTAHFESRPSLKNFLRFALNWTIRFSLLWISQQCSLYRVR